MSKCTFGCETKNCLKKCTKHTSRDNSQMQNDVKWCEGFKMNRKCIKDSHTSKFHPLLMSIKLYQGSIPPNLADWLTSLAAYNQVILW